MMNLTLENIDSCSLSDLLGKSLDCQCGKSHQINMKKVVIEQGAIAKTAGVLQELGYKKALLISDSITWDIAASKVAEVLTENNFDYKPYIIKGRIIPDERIVGDLVIHAEHDFDVILTVGAGVLNDLGKFVSFKLGIDNIVVATAPSVDGFASQHAALVIGNLKISYATACPKAIIGDVDVLKEAPMPMIMAGWSDLMGKYSALSDWKISRIVNDEYYCDVINKMVYKSIQICKDNIEKIKEREPEAIRHIMEGLVLTGIAMSFIGNSRPASGSEHHISHCWEMVALEEGKKIAPHGVQVGVATTMITKLYKKLAAAKVDFAKATGLAQKFDQAKWEKGMENYFHGNAQGLIEEIKADKRYSVEKRLTRIQKLKTKWPEIQAILEEIPSSEQISALLESAGAAAKPQEIAIPAQEAADSIRMAKEVRPKYTILGVLDDLGLLEQFAEEMKADFS
ncbi:hypothetical protein P22_3750 [Propionispora sp. 2/2-37]|uniref:sn-glycerol-1-phosphate dehydrogenase n=1 Tax=Propionispora sp. 2/2-37 TaxID=1677858 RepID=UPI0006BB644B|nr:sn-glycerol-1-phosphate dehydrogenase [Propionispora sp. 2/2-37]CUH97618.1 hypothetical protein P22_3750 [Propionispora sp. 2/2-37]